ncbi:endolytic transglycosylase MltG [Aneurinibacillus migulanus]|uniref:endolytic transglycosylase MltG n=1 Tax=Aneurinibacillus migulanus TaxID=47500 RepID=UPI00209D6F91|nr:endolytic transglycosylase MltG [Aneurinibacillus migulanus]MCP1355392.1 endolytic transglycosylase MltG [Aneurinibacillus migulanus]
MRKIMKIAFGILLLFALGVGGVAYYIWNGLQPVAAEKGQKKIVEIPPSSSLNKIGNILEDNKLIKDARLFSLYAKINGKGTDIKAGKYQLTTGQSIDELLKKMSDGDVYKDTITVTIPEGYTVEQIAARLEQKGLGKKDTFLKEVNSGVFPQEIVKSIPADKRIKYRLEGYLFPDTYEFKKGTTEHQIIERMLERFEDVWKTEWDGQLKQHNLTRHQAVTLASIVEREVRSDDERSKVAGVYFNRLAQQMPLQADATVQYLFGKQKERVMHSDLKQDSPYNTYKVKGLPPGPIASPGEAALQAVTKADKHKFLFYVTKKDGTGQHYFAATYQEHLKNIDKSKTNEK